LLKNKTIKKKLKRKKTLYLNKKRNKKYVKHFLETQKKKNSGGAWEFAESHHTPPIKPPHPPSLHSHM
jgi:hypothetical protein